VIGIVANQEHLDILRQGVEVWNEWIKGHPLVQSDLSGTNFSGANFSGAKLSGVDFIEANLSGANLSRTDLSGANLSHADLRRTNLKSADLKSADLRSANLGGADLYYTDLRDADLSYADLFSANLGGTDLSRVILDGADLGYATIGWTVFGNIDLRTVKGLETVKHQGPSTIGTDTILRSEGEIPEVFLRDAGLDDTFISYVLSLARKPIQYYTCFISYSSKDQAFAERLYADLQSKNVRCWYAPEDLKIGDKFRVRIDESIRLYDKLLLILSEHSVKSLWVETEVETAFSKEHKTGKLALFPVKLDNTIEETEQAWAATIHRTRHIGDFTCWKEHDEYQKGLSRLLRDLKQDAVTS
jgi:hypothetical protein